MVSAGSAAGVATAWRLSLPLALRWATLIGLAKSTQYLFRPLVWENWPWQEVFDGWIEVARDDLVVAIMVAMAIVAGGRISVRTLAGRVAVLAASIAGGALAGGVALYAIAPSWAPRPVGYLIAHGIYWSVLAGSVASMYLVWRRNVVAADALHARELHVAALRRAIVSAQLQALRHQIEPHFLFNTLATIRRLRQSTPEQGSLLLRNFVDFLRLSISPHGRTRNTLGQEIELARAYLAIVAVRMSGRLAIRFDCDDTLSSSEFPALALGTLVENAVKHGIAPKPDGGTITVRTRRSGNDLEAEVADTGAGFTGKQGAGIGLVNIRARLRTLYGKRGELELVAAQPSGVRATIRIPYRPTTEPA